jgi:hypothetical protein
MTKLDFLKTIYKFIKEPNLKSLELSMCDVHHKGVFSLVIAGENFGNLTRVFISDEEINPCAIQFHTHRYPIRLTTIKGNIRHHVAVICNELTASANSMSLFEYNSPLNGGSGLKYLKEERVSIRDYFLPIGTSLYMNEKEFHTVSCSPGSIWVVEELGFKNNGSLVLGSPFVTEGLYKPCSSFQINDKCQIVYKEVKKLILDYETI